MPRQRVANYVVNEGTVISDFQNVSAWAVSSGAIEADAAHFKTGTQGIKFKVMTAGGDVTADLTTNFDGASMISVWAYIPDISAVSTIIAYLSADAGFTKFSRLGVAGTGIMPDTINPYTPRWYLLKFPLNQMTKFGGDGLDTPRVKVRLKVTATAGKLAMVTFDDLRINQKVIPKIVFSFDGTHSGAYDIAAPMMQAKGYKGIMYVDSHAVGTPERMTLAQVQDLQNTYGWDIGNHTVTHPRMTTLTDNQIIAEANGCREYQFNHGIASAWEHFCYPEGAYDPRVENILLSLGFKTGRTIDQIHQEVPVPNMMELSTKIQLSNTTTFGDNRYNDAKPRIDEAVRQGSTLFIFGHNVANVPVGGYDVATSVFQQMVNYISELKLDVRKMTEWYNGLTNPRRGKGN